MTAARTPRLDGVFAALAVGPFPAHELHLVTHPPKPTALAASQIGPLLGVQSTLACTGGARAPSGSCDGYCSGAVRCRCHRIFAMTCGSSTLARILSLPPQRAQPSISMANTTRAAICSTSPYSRLKTAPAALVGFSHS